MNDWERCPRCRCLMSGHWYNGKLQRECKSTLHFDETTEQCRLSLGYQMLQEA